MLRYSGSNVLFKKACLLILSAIFFCSCESRDITSQQRGSIAKESPENPRRNDNFRPVYLRCEYRVDPLGIDIPKPRLSWVLESNQRGQRQTGYRIIAASSEEMLKNNQGDLWDTGFIETDRSSHVVYKGKALRSRMRCYWKVKVRDKQGRESEWSDPAIWTMGLLEDSDWKAEWIGLNNTIARGDEELLKAKWIWLHSGRVSVNAKPGPCYFRRMISIPKDKEIVKATCEISADDSFVLYINQNKVGGGDNWAHAKLFDILEYLVKGNNIFAVEATNNVPKDKDSEDNPAGLVAIFRIEFTDSEILYIPTNRQWKGSLKKQANWRVGQFNDVSWLRATEVARTGGKVWEQLTSAAKHLPGAKYLRKNFTINKPINRATVYATALGLYELHINGKKAGRDHFTPGWTDYNKRIYYNTYDVTGFLGKGENVIGSLLGDGWYCGYTGHACKREYYGVNSRFLTQLHIEFDDGSEQIVSSDKSWKASEGAFLEADMLMGETYDSRKEPTGWDKAGFDDSNWKAVDTGTKTKGKLQSYPGIPVRKFKEIEPVSITEPEKGHYVFDMGSNIAGWARLKVTGKAGDKIVLRFAERLNEDGSIYTENLRRARATDTYICRGSGEKVWEPRFTFHGFQYVEVTGYPGKPGKDSIRGIEITADLPVTGSFECSDKHANALYRNICQSQRANFIEIPTDCPQRDERLGWTGDAQIYVRTASYNSDVAAFFTKWVTDLTDAQTKDGAFTNTAPKLKGLTVDGPAAWADAGVICPWTIWRVYGDKRILRKHYKAMAKWIEYCQSNSKELLRPDEGYGDWLNINDETPKDVLGTAYFAYSTKLMAQIAKELEKDKDAVKFNKLFGKIKDAFNKAYVSKDGKIKGDTQTSYVLALAFELVDKEKNHKAKEHLVRKIKEKDGYLSTGFVGTKDLMGVLTKIGRSDIAYRLFQNESFPSWFFSVKHGATSIWERWDGWTPENGFQNPGMNSFSHYAFGAVGEWMFKTIGGIDTARAGFKDIIIRPKPGGKIKWARVNYNSINGEIQTDWKIKSGKFILDVTIPANTTATVFVPAKTKNDVIKAEVGPYVKFIGIENEAAVYRIESGSYQFISRM